MIDWPAVFERAKNQPRILENIRTHSLYAIAPQHCAFTDQLLTSSCFGFLYQTPPGRPMLIFCDEQFYLNNSREIRNYFEIVQGFWNEPFTILIVDNIPNFSQHKAWINSGINFVKGSFKDVEHSSSSTYDNTRLAGREDLDESFMETRREITGLRIEALEHKPDQKDAFELLDQLKDARVVTRHSNLLEDNSQ